MLKFKLQFYPSIRLGNSDFQIHSGCELTFSLVEMIHNYWTDSLDTITYIFTLAWSISRVHLMVTFR